MVPKYALSYQLYRKISNNELEGMVLELLGIHCFFHNPVGMRKIILGGMNNVKSPYC